MLREDLRDWFRERWVNIAKKKKDGGYAECGTSGKKKGYAKCVPAAKAARMSKTQIKSAVSRKRAAQTRAGRPGKDQPGQGNAPIMVKTMKEQYLAEKNSPTNPKLWSQAKSLARSKFDVYPSALSNAWAAKWYKKRGGGWKGTTSESLSFKNFREVEQQTSIYNTTLNPDIWNGMELKSEVRAQLLKIAQAFITTWELEIPIKDIILTGSNANYNWTKFSDFDLHIIVQMGHDMNAAFLAKYLKVKKEQFNKQHNIRIRGYPVEVYAQDESENLVATGQFSLQQNIWRVIPTPLRPSYNHPEILAKSREILQVALKAIREQDMPGITAVIQKIAQMRKAGLASGGEFSVENMAFKVLRNSGIIEKLRAAIRQIEDRQLSLENRQMTLQDRLWEAATAAWQRSEGKDPEGGLNRKGIASYRRQNPGSKLSMAVTTDPSKLKKGSKRAKRRKSFCARMSGMKRRLTSTKTANDPNSRINKSLRKWNC